MFFLIVPGARHREAETYVAASLHRCIVAIDARGRRWNKHQQEPFLEIDFADYNKQRYAAIGAARASRTVPPSLAPPRSRWAHLWIWATAGWAWVVERGGG